MAEEIQAKTGHPKGLWVLFGTEMWERFNFYGMRTLLTLFIVNALLMSKEESSLIYGGFLGLCYLTPMLGGFIADRYLGNRYCIILGGSLMAIGQLLLFFSASVFSTNIELAKTLLYVALGVIIFGNGFFKPNISSMVGSLYPKQEKNKLDTAFTIFYMGINIGAFLGQFICPFLGDVTDADGNRDIFAFKWGFMAASAAMVVGTLTFWFLKDKYVVNPEGRPIGGLPSKNSHDDYEEGEATSAQFTGKSLGLAVVAFILLALAFHFFVGQNVIYSIIYGSGLTLAGLILSDKSLTKIETDRILVIYIVSFFVIFFWAAFEQAGSSLTFIADNQTDRNFLGWDMPPSMVQIFNGIFVVMFAVPFSALWDRLRASGKEPISPFKQAIGLLLIAVSYFIIAHNVKDLGNSGLLAIKWLILLYLIQTFGELCLSPIGLSLVGKLAPRRFASLLFGVFFLSNASGYALAGTLGSILPPTSEQFVAAEKQKIDLQGILDGKVDASGNDLYVLAINKAAKIDEESAKENKLDISKRIEKAGQLKSEREAARKKKVEFVNKYTAKDTTFTAAEFQLIKDKKIIKAEYPSFAGFTLHNLYEFFMVFVVLCGVASVLLFALTPKLKKMMHGVN
ncbi:peptide MFS transporter [Flavobacterium sp.]|uniref:peptide MFS transporter n=1 Tax=Flavobacterium sp. TaxID=239 RepID=UPI0025B93A3C|nr:peptide MFS transporter [Flavobacterium sp.]